jgi:hypothetical protein
MQKVESTVKSAKDVVMMRSRIINISIQRGPRTVYGFVSNLENLPR